jgi:hypothetical protein
MRKGYNPALGTPETSPSVGKIGCQALAKALRVRHHT